MALGRGLDALLGDSSLQAQTGGSVSLPIAQVEPGLNQPRKHFEEEALADLAESIRQHGMIQPLTVRRLASGYYQIIAGERRWRAARMAGLEEVPATIIEADDRKVMELGLIENLQREDLHYFEEAAAIAAYLQQTGATQEEAAAQLGRSPSAVANKLRLLRLSPACRAILVENNLTERHARCLLRLEDEEERLAAARYLARNHLNVAQAEQYVERRLAALQSTPPAGRKTYIIKDVRLFLNSLDRGLRLIREAGVDARTERQETEEDILLTIRIPKQRRGVS